MNYPISKLKDCCTIIAGQSPESKYYNTAGEGMPFFQGKADFGDLYPTIRVYCSQPTKIAEKDDILLSVRAPVGPTNLAPCQVCIGRGLTAIRPSSQLLTGYVLMFFRFFEAQLALKGTGTTFNAITQNVVKNLEIPIPPLNEQSRIVARIEELFSELDNSVSTLQKTKEQLAVYRQAVLKDAFDSINADSVCIQDVCEKIIDCPHSTPNWTRDGYLCLRTTNFRRGYLDLSEPNYVSKDTFDARNQRLIPMPGDVLYSREGAILGLACIIPSDTYVCLGQRMMLLRAGNKLSNMYLMHFLNSPRLTNFVASVTGGSASPHVNVGDIKNFQMPFPDINEQGKIVEFIESRLSVCDSIDHTVDTALQQAEAMRQSILKQAFEGR